jgi:uncharacterized CHY-type Zn-finger protein
MIKTAGKHVHGKGCMVAISCTSSMPHYMVYQRMIDLVTQPIRELHKPISHPYQEELQLCSHCGNEVDGSWIYPCPTIKALDGEQE